MLCGIPRGLSSRGCMDDGRLLLYHGVSEETFCIASRASFFLVQNLFANRKNELSKSFVMSGLLV